MQHLVLIDYPLLAAGLAGLFRHHRSTWEVLAFPTDPRALAPPGALVLIECALPEQHCGLRLARQLQRSRPDLTTLVWTTHPTPLATWAAAEYKLAGCLDKAMPVLEVVGWLDHAMTTGAAWPGALLAQAREWEQTVAARLRGLTKNLWLLWAGLLRGESNPELAAHLRWSRRTIERRLGALYTALGVQRRSEAVTTAWTWGLVEVGDAGLNWSSVVRDLFPIPTC
jgi:DNA-binding NarL/FixJ family response regulator